MGHGPSEILPVGHPGKLLPVTGQPVEAPGHELEPRYIAPTPVIVTDGHNMPEVGQRIYESTFADGSWRKSPDPEAQYAVPPTLEDYESIRDLEPAWRIPVPRFTSEPLTSTASFVVDNPGVLAQVKAGLQRLDTSDAALAARRAAVAARSQAQAPGGFGFFDRPALEAGKTKLALEGTPEGHAPLEATRDGGALGSMFDFLSPRTTGAPEPPAETEAAEWSSKVVGDSTAVPEGGASIAGLYAAIGRLHELAPGPTSLGPAALPSGPKSKPGAEDNLDAAWDAWAAATQNPRVLQPAAVRKAIDAAEPQAELTGVVEVTPGLPVADDDAELAERAEVFSPRPETEPRTSGGLGRLGLRLVTSGLRRNRNGD